MRLIQITPTLSQNDAIFNEVCAVSEIFESDGIKCVVYAENIAKSALSSGLEIRKIETLSASGDDIILYHHSIGCKSAEIFSNLSAKRKVLYYHNITPPEFFDSNPPLQKLCRLGRSQLPMLCSAADSIAASSEYNSNELRELTRIPLTTVPIYFNAEKFFSVAPDFETVRNLSGGNYKNILFVGRIAPNKCQHNIIKIFALIKRYISKNARLFLVGTDVGNESYLSKLKAMCYAFKLDGVYFTGSVDISRLAAFYKCADVFLSMSEHEGFGVPLLEASAHGVPIVAFGSEGVENTLADSGIILKTNDLRAFAEAVWLAASSEKVRRYLISKQYERLKAFDKNKTVGRLKNVLFGF